MNNPVAWQVAEMLFDIEESAIEMAKVYGDKIIPLYTHPVKELTEEEIVWLWADCEKTGTGATYINFARAILRKAKEK